jgi:rubrerythrin
VMSDEIGRLDQFWECPRCGFQFAMGAPGRLSPPTCGMGHEPVEMEQKAAEAFGGRDV